MFSADAQHYDDLYDSISQLLLEQQDVLGSERRTSERHSYETVQLIAPFDGVRLPSQSDFQQVLCRDLSPSGFSYFGLPPRTDYLVVALGNVPFKFFEAQVVRETTQRRDDEMHYVIGCRFNRRIN